MNKIETNFKAFVEIKALLIYDFVLHWILLGLHMSIDSKIAWSVSNGEYRNIVPDARFNDIFFTSTSIVLTLAFIGLWRNMWTGYVFFCLSLLLSLVQSACWGIQAHSPEVMVATHVEHILCGLILIFWVIQKRKQTGSTLPEAVKVSNEP